MTATATLDSVVSTRPTFVITIPSFRKKETGIIARVRNRIRLTKASITNICSAVWNNWVGRTALVFLGSFITGFACYFLAIVPAFLLAALLMFVTGSAVVTEVAFWTAYLAGICYLTYKNIMFWSEIGEL